MWCLRRRSNILANLTSTVKHTRYIEGLTFVIYSIPAKCRRTARRAATGRIRSLGVRDGSETALLAATEEAACNGEG